jgi:hypothetical protein
MMMMLDDAERAGKGGDTDVEPVRCGKQSFHLSQTFLLLSFGSDRLKQDLGGGTAVHVRQEAIDTGLSPASEDLAEIDELAYAIEGVGVVTDFNGSLVSKHVIDCRRMSNFLFRPKLNQIPLARINTSVIELAVVELSKTMVEQV